MYIFLFVSAKQNGCTVSMDSGSEFPSYPAILTDDQNEFYIPDTSRLNLLKDIKWKDS